MKILTLSFDDCEIHDRRLCKILRSYGIPATFYLISGLLGQCVPYRRYGEDTLVQRVAVQELASTYSGMEIASHTRFHRISNDTLEQDISVSLEELSHACGYAVKGFAYPGGAFTPEQARRLTNTGVLYARGASSTHRFDIPENWYQWQPTCHYADPELSDLIEAFLALDADEDAIFHIYGHSYELTQPDPTRDWHHLEAILQQLSHREDVHYATNLECFRLINIR